MNDHRSLSDEEYKAIVIVLATRLLAFSKRLSDNTNDFHQVKPRMDYLKKIWEKWSNHIDEGTLIINKNLTFYADLEIQVADNYYEAMARANDSIDRFK